MLSKEASHRIWATIERLRRELEDAQQRGAVSKNMVLREYLCGQVLFPQNSTDHLLGERSAEELLDQINAELRTRPFETGGVVAALVRNPDEQRSYVVFMHLRA